MVQKDPRPLGGSVFLVSVVGKGGAGGKHKGDHSAFFPTNMQGIIPLYLTSDRKPHTTLLAAGHGYGGVGEISEERFAEGGP
jgi:hypothetical protein